MACSTDLASISMAHFADALLTGELLPSRRALQQIAAGYEAATGDGAAALRVADVQYVQRYCEALSTEIEW